MVEINSVFYRQIDIDRWIQIQIDGCRYKKFIKHFSKYISTLKYLPQTDMNKTCREVYVSRTIKIKRK